MVDRAMSMLDQPYRWGGAAPGGFDCSGLVAFAAAGAGIRVPRTAHEQLASGMPIARGRASGGRSRLHAAGAQGIACRHRNRQRAFHPCALRRRPRAHRLARGIALRAWILDGATPGGRAVTYNSRIIFHNRQSPRTSIMKLYYSPGACSLSPHIVLLEARPAVSRWKRSTSRPRRPTSGVDYSTINSKGAVPTLELDDGRSAHRRTGDRAVSRRSETGLRIGAARGNLRALPADGNPELHHFGSAQEHSRRCSIPTISADWKSREHWPTSTRNSIG